MTFRRTRSSGNGAGPRARRTGIRPTGKNTRDRPRNDKRSRLAAGCGSRRRSSAATPANAAMFSAACAITGAATLPDRSRSAGEQHARAPAVAATTTARSPRPHGVARRPPGRAAAAPAERPERRVHVPEPEPDRGAHDRADRRPRCAAPSPSSTPRKMSSSASAVSSGIRTNVSNAASARPVPVIFSSASSCAGLRDRDRRRHAGDDRHGGRQRRSGSPRRARRAEPELVRAEPRRPRERRRARPPRRRWWRAARGARCGDARRRCRARPTRRPPARRRSGAVARCPASRRRRGAGAAMPDGHAELLAGDGAEAARSAARRDRARRRAPPASDAAAPSPRGSCRPCRAPSSTGSAGSRALRATRRCSSSCSGVAVEPEHRVEERQQVGAVVVARRREHAGHDVGRVLHVDEHLEERRSSASSACPSAPSRAASPGRRATPAPGSRARARTRRRRRRGA